MVYDIKNAALKVFGCAAILVSVMTFNITSANAVVVGDPATDRDFADTFTEFIISLPGEIIPVNGFIESWKVFAEAPGDLALLLLSGSANTPTVQAVFQETAGAGLNNYVLGSPEAVQVGWFLGIWMDDGKVSFDESLTGVTFSSDGSFPSPPNVNDVLALTGGISRDYSINATVVPLPAALPLFAAALVGLGFVGRRKHKAQAA